MSRVYKDVPYVGVPNPTSHPDHLRAIAALFGLDAAPVPTCRMLELGCGDGANLLPIAAAYPDATFVGCDLTARAVDRAQRISDSLRLTNVSLSCQDFRKLPSDLGTFDYVVAHGLYSWIPEDARLELLPSIARHLAPHGIAFVSYNAYPGCHVRQAAWEMLKHHTRHIDDASDKLVAARGLIALVAEPSQAHEPIDEAIRSEIRQLGDRSDSLLCHDDLGEPNLPVYFHEFAADAARSRLAFVAEADLSCIAGPHVAPEVAARLASMDRLERQQFLDFVRMRRYRESLLCHADAHFEETIDPARVADLYAYPSTRLLASGREASPDEDIDAHRVKELLIARWPHAVPVAELVESLVRPDADRATIESRVVGLFAGASINLRHDAPAVAAVAGTHPVAFAPARCAFREQTFVPNVYHEGVRIDSPDVRRLVEFLDGHHSRAQLAAEVAGPFAGPNGAAQLEASLAGLASMALLVG